MNIQLSPKENRLLIIMVVVFLVTVLGPGFGANFADNYLAQESSRRTTLEREIADYNSRLSGIESERETIRANQQEYLQWVERGLVGEQNPVEWVKTMQEIQKSRRLFPLTYSLSENVLIPSSASPLTDYPNSTVRIRHRGMQLEMAMLHDLDVLMFLEALHANTTSLFYPIECNFTLLEKEFALADRPNINSDCMLAWVSANDPDRKVGNDSAAVPAQGANGGAVGAAPIADSASDDIARS